MKLTFTKKRGKLDALWIERIDSLGERIDCPKQGIIPHDMVHVAVEKVVTGSGSLSRVADGETVAFRMTRQDEAEAIERLVETMQAEAWSSRTPAFRRSAPGDLLALYHISCSARSHTCLPVSEAEIELIRQEIDMLTEQWAAVPVGGSLTLVLGDLA